MYLPTKNLFISNVTFEPGCRNNWHIHKATKGGGQILLCIAGKGWYQEEGKQAKALKPGDVVEIPANIKHWHGATKDSYFAHLAIALAGENQSNEWCETLYLMRNIIIYSIKYFSIKKDKGYKQIYFFLFL